MLEGYKNAYKLICVTPICFLLRLKIKYRPNIYNEYYSVTKVCITSECFEGWEPFFRGVIYQSKVSFHYMEYSASVRKLGPRGCKKRSED